MLLKKNEEYKNKINELEITIKELKIQLKEKDKLLKEEKIKNDREYINNSLLLKQNKEYENKKNELESIIKKLNIQLKEKDKLLEEEKIKNDNLNKKIKEISTKANKIKELENEIKLFRTYYNFSSDEKLISIKFISINQDIDFTIITKNTDDFSNIEKILYKKYPRYKDSENYFVVNGSKINRNRTLEENKIRNNDVLTLQINNFDYNYKIN